MDVAESRRVGKARGDDMHRVKIIACAGTGTVLAAMASLLSAVPGILSNLSSDLLSRSAGLALLGIALIAAGLAFWAAARAEQKPTASITRPQASEYRRGFGDGFVPLASLRRPAGRCVVTPLRRAAAKEGDPREPGIVLSIAETERLRDILRRRAARLGARNADLAERRFMRSTVHPRGLAPQQE